MLNLLARPEFKPALRGDVTAALHRLALMPAFRGVPWRALLRIGQCGQMLFVPQSATLLEKGELIDCLYLVVRGHLHIETPRIGVLPRARLGPGALLGAVALLSGMPQAFTARALDEVLVLRAFKAELGSLMIRYPTVLAALLRLARERAALSRASLTNLLQELDFLQVQLQVLSETSGPHHTRDIEQRLARMRYRLDETESQIRSIATALGASSKTSLGDIRRWVVASSAPRRTPTGASWTDDASISFRGCS
jgi:CRP-like cAMP-binding protein